MFKCCLQLNSETLRAFPQSPAHTVMLTHMCAHTHTHTHAHTHTQEHTGPLGLLAIPVSSGSSPCCPAVEGHWVLTGVWHVDAHTCSSASHCLCKHVWNKSSAPWEKSYDQPRQHVKKQRHYFVSKRPLVKAMVFPVVMYRCESLTVKKAERRRIDAFELWCWRRLLRVPWTARRSSQSVLKEISPEYPLEGLMLKLKLQYFGQMMQRADAFERGVGGDS